MQAASTKSIRILIVDDHALMRAGLRILLESQPGITLVGEAATPAEALGAASRQQPDIILLDLDLGQANGLDILPQLHAAAPDTSVIVLTGGNNSDMHRRAIRLGAMGLVPKQKGVETLLEAIAKVSAGEVWLDGLLVASVLNEMARLQADHGMDPDAIKIKGLTKREREVITLVGQGLKNQGIADRLCISEATVRHHLTSIFDKLGVTDRLELAIYAYQHGLAYLLPRDDVH